MTKIEPRLPFNRNMLSEKFLNSPNKERQKIIKEESSDSQQFEEQKSHLKEIDQRIEDEIDQIKELSHSFIEQNEKFEIDLKAIRKWLMEIDHTVKDKFKSINDLSKRLSSFESKVEKFQFTHTQQLEKNIEDLKEKFLIGGKGSSKFQQNKIPQGTQNEITESLKKGIKQFVNKNILNTLENDEKFK